MLRHFTKKTAIALLLVTTSLTAHAGEENKWNPHIELEAKKGNHRNITETELFLPLRQTNTSLLFMDVRGMLDNTSNREGNIGLGFRTQPNTKLLGQDWILGAYSFLDIRRTKHHNKFIQGTFGLEALTEDWDARTNIYLPQGGAKTINGTANVSASLSGTQLRITGTGNQRERALPGLDAEIGYKLPALENTIDAIRVYGGGFYFDADDYKTVAGPRIRTELSWNDLPLFGDGSRITLGGELQHDNVRDTTAFASARLRIPLNFNNKKKRRPLSALDQRMNTRIIRDVDVVSGTQAPEINEAATVTINGVATENLIILDANDDVPTEITNAGAGAAILLDGSAGTIDNTATTISMQNSQTITGGGLTVTGENSGLTATIGTRPTITANAATNIITIAGTDNITLQNLNLTGGNNGINITAVSENSTYRNLNITDTASAGIATFRADNNTFTNISLSNLGTNGISLGRSSHNTLTNITGTNITSTGLIISQATNNTINNLNFDTMSNGISLSLAANNTVNASSISNTTGNGIETTNSGNFTLNNTTITNAGTNSFSFTGSTNLSGTGNTSTNPTTADCDDGGGNTGSIAYNATTCP